MKSCVIFGAGRFGSKAYKRLQGKYQILAYLDNDVKKQGTRYNGAEIYPAEELPRFVGADVIVAARIPYPIVAQLKELGESNPIYIFDPRSGDENTYLLYRVEDGDICVPEYMDSRYTLDESLRCHYSGLPVDVLRLFQTALGWIQDSFPVEIKIVELGCGSGQFANMLFDAGYTNYIGYDFSSAAIARAAELNPIQREHFRQKDIREIKWSDDVELIVIFEVLEHMADDIAAVEALPDGVSVLFTVPNFDSFNHVRKFDGLSAIVERYGTYFQFSRYQRIDTKYGKCWFLLEGKKFRRDVINDEIQ